MVHLDKVEGQRGSIVMQEDGSILSSTGTLSSSEQTATTITTLLNHNLQVDFTGSDNNQKNGAAVHAVATETNKSNDVNNTGEAVITPVLKWNRLTVSFPTHSYVACLSNKKIHVVDRDKLLPLKQAPATTNPDDDELIAQQDS